MPLSFQIRVFVRDAEHQMLCAKSNRIGGFAALALFSALFAFGGINAARAQQNRQRAFRPAARRLMIQMPFAFNSWLLYPSVNFLAENSNNYFISPQSKLSGLAFGVDPEPDRRMVQRDSYHNALWQLSSSSNIPRIIAVPQESKISAPSGEATWTQQYAPLRDLNFTFVGDYVHQTLQPV